MLPDRWIKTPNGKTSCIETGYHLFQRDHPLEAWPWFERALRVGLPTADDNLLGAICLYHGLGRFRDAMSLLRRTNELCIGQVKFPSLVNKHFRVLDGFWARHIGNTAELDYIIKLGILEGRSREETILYLPPGSSVANRFFLQQFATHLRLVGLRRFAIRRFGHAGSPLRPFGSAYAGWNNSLHLGNCRQDV